MCETLFANPMMLFFLEKGKLAAFFEGFEL